MDVFRSCWLFGLILLTGCASGPGARTGGVVGTGLGAGAGAIIGHQSGHAGEGALIGAVGGAVVGNAIGHSADAQAQRDAVIAQTSGSVPAGYGQLTNDQLVRMAHAGLADDVIINSVQTSGGQFDLSPNGLIFLKTNGVSDRVIHSVQSLSTVATTAPAANPVYRPGGFVVVRPHPIIRVGTAPRRSTPRPTVRGRGGRGIRR